MRDPQRLVLGGVRHQHGELVAAEARDGVDVPDHAEDPARDLDQDPVAGAVPETVVDRLELVEVEQQDARRPLAALRPGGGLADPVAEQGAVGQAGQRVVEGQPLHVAAGLVQLGGALGDPILHRALHEVELFGEQVDAR